MVAKLKVRPFASLTQYFDAPQGYAGEFGWLCGYSAEAAFMDNAAERFSALTGAARSQLGSFHLGLMTDPSCPLITAVDAPGVFHAAFKSQSTKPFALLHAKVAILSFRHQEERSQWLIRLVVSTGNWTRQTVEDSLDLAWCVEVDSAQIATPSKETQQACADLMAAWDLLREVRSWFDLRLLSLAEEARGSNHSRLEAQIQACQAATHQLWTPRFFDSRRAPLLKQVIDKVKAIDPEAPARNYLAMGSGFFESVKKYGTGPEVPECIVEQLQSSGLLTKNAEVDVFVNPMACQAIAHWKPPRTVALRPAAAPVHLFGELSNRSLHAKFVFGAKGNASGRLRHSWAYLGSGNLTHPGLMRAMSPSGGNLEAGVVFGAGEQVKNGESPDARVGVLTELLPVQFEREVGTDCSVQAGEDFEHPDSWFEAPPIAWLDWESGDQDGFIKVPAAQWSAETTMEVRLPYGSMVTLSKEPLIWPGPQPRLVTCRWPGLGGFTERSIPVVDGYGRVASIPMPALDIHDVWWQLAAFPQVENEEDPGDGGDESAAPFAHPSPSSGELGSSLSYPIRQLMELLENIATKQTCIPAEDWPGWCSRLEQTLVRAKDSSTVAFFKAGPGPRLNPLSPLRQSCFRPSYAEDASSPEGQAYEAMLARIEQAWGVNGLASIGGAR